MDATYPMFVLAFCIFGKDAYVQQVVPALQRIKFKYCGHDLVVLHEREMRKQAGSFRFLGDRQVRTAFMNKKNRFVEQAPFTVIAAVINKAQLKLKYRNRPVIHVDDSSHGRSYWLRSTWRTNGRIVRNGSGELTAGGRAG